MNRRDVLRNAAAAPLVVLPFAAARAAQPEPGSADPFAGWQAEKFIELPLRPGDEITGLVVHRDELWAATRYGELYRVSRFR